jgi:hypothetical protein
LPARGAARRNRPSDNPFYGPPINWARAEL